MTIIKPWISSHIRIENPSMTT